jgi:hypothetical protein
MAIQKISRVEVDQCMSLRSFMEGLIGQGVEWFTDGSGSVIGTFAQDKTRQDWGYMILKRDGRGEYGAYNIRRGLQNDGTARIEVLLAMEASEREHRQRVAADLPQFVCGS